MLGVKRKTKIDTVIFDVGNVLYRWDLRCLFEKLIDDGQELDWFLDNVVTPDWHFQHDAGRPLSEMVPERIALFPKYESLINAYAARFNETIPGPVAGSIELVERLAAKQVPIFGITNFGAEFWAGFCPTAPVFDHFQSIIVSGEEKLAKPDRAIYELALQRFGLEPVQCLFVDDRLENIDAGEQLGIFGHHFHDAASLETELLTLKLI